MTTRMILVVLAVLCLALALAIVVGSRRQQGALSAQVDRLIRAGRAQPAATESDPLQIEDLPAPVARYLRLANPARKHLHEVRLTQTGTLRTDLNSERWMSFDAEHIVVPQATGFVWNARVSVAPLIHVRVRDAFVDGRGSGLVSLLSALTVGEDADSPEMNSGSLHRYLAEAVWYPTALVPSSQLTWTALDATRALATLTNQGVTVSLEFRFGESGEVTGIFTPARWGKFGEGYRQVPWEGHFRDYREQDGILVPSEGDVGWYVANEWQPVWKGRITAFVTRSGP
jgi:hypothetical protein